MEKQNRSYPPNLFGISGRIGSGKDTVGEIIQKLCLTNKGPNFEIKKFAGKLKTIGSLISGVGVEKFEDQDFKKQSMGEEWEMTYREFLQKLGTEAMRDNLHENVWINALFADYKPRVTYQMEILDLGASDLQREKIGKPVNSEYPNWIITDMRFPNEMEAVVKRNGVTIRVIRDTTCPECGVTGGHKMYVHKDKSLTDLHPSETALDDADFDYTIHNSGTLEDLVDTVRAILVLENIIDK